MERSSARRFELDLVHGEFAICRLPPSSPLPDWAAGDFVSASRTPDELSLVCPARQVPEGIRADRGWSCLRLAGPFDFDEIGVLASVAAPLAAARIGIFVISTFDTDYLLVKAAACDRAAAALTAAGHVVRGLTDERNSR